MKNIRALFLLLTLLSAGLLPQDGHAQMALVQRMDLGLGSDRKMFTGWLMKQGFVFDTEGQSTTRQMATGMSDAYGVRLYGETYLNQAGNIRVRLFTDTLFVVFQIQLVLARPVAEECKNFITSLQTIGYRQVSQRTDSKDKSVTYLLEKSGKMFRLVDSPWEEYLLIKATREDLLR
jgi:hypothetical protein